MTTRSEPIVFLDDQPITRMPERCTLWPCSNRGPFARLRPVERYGHWYMQCPCCEASYGECDRPAYELAAGRADS